jgi:hypothetical protein
MKLAAATGLAILLLAGAANAAGSQTFADPVGDNQPNAPDISTVQVSNDDSEHVEVRVTLANRPDLLDDEFVTVYLDRDGDTRTGCGEGVGVDFSLGAVGHAMPEPDFFVLLRCLGGTFDLNTPQTGFSGSYDTASQTAIFDLSCANIGRPASFRLVVVTQHGQSSGSPTFDFAGAEQPWIYTVSPRCARDTKAPRVKALPSRGVRGGKAKLRYRISDDSGETQEKISVYRGKRRIASTTTVWGAADGSVHYVVWPSVPRHIGHSLRFCIRAKDRAGNRSRLNCALLKVR